MRKYRKIISAVMTLAMVIALAMPASAASTSASALNSLGLLLNVTESELDTQLTREVGLTMILKSLGYSQKEADASATNGAFTDVSGWSKGWAELAYTEGITTGVGNNKFSPTSALTEKEFVAFQLRALAYDSSDSWNNAVTLGQGAGLISSDNNLTATSYTKRDAAEVMYKALTARIDGSTVRLIDQLIDENIVSKSQAEAFNLISNSFEVKSITSDNLKIITLEFSQAIDESTLSGNNIDVLEDGDSLKYDDNYLDGVAARTYVLHLVNEREVDIVFGSNQSQNSTFTIEVSDVLNTSGEVVSPYNTRVKMIDQSKPYPMEANLLNPIYLEIVFNESLQTKTGTIYFDENLLIDGDDFTGTLSLSNDMKTVYVKLKKPLIEGAYTLTVEDFSDFAGYTSNTKEFSILSEEDNEKPYVVEAIATNREEVEIVFNELIIEDEGELTINGDTYELDDEDDEDYLDINEKTIVVTLKSPLKASAATTGVVGSYEDIEDMMGNSVSNETTFTFKAAIDKIAPTMEVEVNDKNAIIVTFSEEVQEFSTSYFAITEYDEDEDEDVAVGIGDVDVYDSSSTAYIIVLEDPTVNAAEYDLVVMGVKDKSVYENKLAKVEMTIDFADKEQPEVEAVKYLGDNKIRITFSEPMDVDKLEDPDYYIYHDEKENEEYDLDDVDYDIEVDSDYEYVDIEIDDLDEDDRIQIGRLTDESGLLLRNYNKTYSFDSVSEFDEDEVEARLIDGDTIKLIADDHDFDVIDEDDFLIRSGNKESETHYVTDAYIDEDDANIAYIILSSDLDGEAEASGRSQYLYLEDDVVTRDTFNQALDISFSDPVLIKDYTQPVIEIDDSEEKTLILEISEVVGTNSDDDIIDDLLLKDEDDDFVDLEIGDNVELSGGNKTFAFFETITITGLKGGDNYTIEVLSHNIKDSNGNRVEKLDETTVQIED